MSEAEEIAGRFTKAAESASAARARPRRRIFARWRSEPLLPEAGAGGAPLTAVIAVMSFLAALALAAFIFIVNATATWTSELKSEITVQVKGADAAEIAAKTKEALRILNSTSGVIEARAEPPEAAAKLLEPWLGAGNIGAYLNVPALIEVKVTRELRGDLDGLRTRLAAAAPGAVLDDHRRWHRSLSSAAHSGEFLAFAVFALIMAAACAIAIFAARAGLAANSEIVAILHLVGATDDFIANEVQRRFFVIGLRGSLAGLVVAILALALIELAMRAAGGGSDFLPTLKVGPWLAGILLAVPISLCFVTAATARLTVLGALGKEL